ncbi:MAG: LysR family transcriptional regulator [Deltaproteobacteria bacterium]|nr:LysR family transcriptional regulator [Deltaproteobacteria bacterium]
MDYNDLALFTRVVERGSFSDAARTEGLPKSSVTRSIARLEKELGVRLIQRTTRQRGVTDAGRELYERVRGAVGALEEAADAIREQGKDPRGVVRVTAPGDAGLMELPQAFVELARRYPSIHVELLLTNRVVDLVGEGVDIAIRAGKLADSSLVARKVGQTNAALFASPAYLDRRGRPKKVSDLAEHDCVMFRARNGRQDWTLEGPKGEESVDVGGPLGSDDFSFNLRLIEAGVGIGVLPMFIGCQRKEHLERVLPKHSYGAAGQLYVVMPSASFIPARVAVTRDFLVEHLQKLLA